MQAFIDFIPLLLALVAYQAHGIFAATVVLMVTLPLIPLGQWILGRKVSQVHVWSAVLVLVFGGTTLVLRDPRFVMAKPTVLYLGLGIAFLMVPRFTGKSVVEKIMGEVVQLAPPAWLRLNLAWVVFFVLMAILNVAVAMNFSEAVWFQFKVWGITGLTFVFIVGQSVWMSLNAIESPDEPAPDNKPTE